MAGDERACCASAYVSGKARSALPAPLLPAGRGQGPLSGQCSLQPCGTDGVHRAEYLGLRGERDRTCNKTADDLCRGCECDPRTAEPCVCSALYGRFAIVPLFRWNGYNRHGHADGLEDDGPYLPDARRPGGRISPVLSRWNFV